ncbi:MAG: envelope stress response membrane protein PspB [Alphaproteobacteria bacterium]|nr:envelope stress response membrane protein PspB [Alphaproteobacteria bacterium]TAD89212.1 MAG: envelope stress response membrane protein PspB [Alphaproteobacteria bacterium]
MSVFGFILGILALVIVVPLWLLLHYVTRWRSQRSLSDADEQMLARLWETARRLEDRIGALERAVLDDDPDRRPHS